MKTFKQYLIENHPEVVDEGAVGNILTAAALGLAGAGLVHDKVIKPRSVKADATARVEPSENDNKKDVARQVKNRKNQEKELTSMNKL